MNEPLEPPPLNPVIADRAALIEKLANDAEEELADGDPEALAALRSTHGNEKQEGVSRETLDETTQDSKINDEFVTLKVDGETIQKPKSEVEDHGGVKAYQMELAAEKRLSEAKRILDEAKQLRKTADQPPPEEHQSEDVDVAVAQALRVGTDDEALQNVRRFKQNIVVEAKEAIKAEDDRDWFLNEYKDVRADPRLFSALLEEDARNWHSGDHRPRRERWTELGNEYRKYLKPASPLDIKRERKASVTTIPSASVRGQAAQIDEGPDDSPQALIEAMRKARGQA